MEMKIDNVPFDTFYFAIVTSNDKLTMKQFWFDMYYVNFGM